MTAPGTRPTISTDDADRADAVLDAWAAEAVRNMGAIYGAEESLLELRGMLLAAFADCRHDAYADALADFRAAGTDA